MSGVIDCGPCRLRPWRLADLDSMVSHADNSRVAATLRDTFPNPYTRDDGLDWLEYVIGKRADVCWAIDVADEAVGGIALVPQRDINAGTAEIGYWLGEPFWNRGIATAAVRCLTRHALTSLGYRRLSASAFEPNRASQRVLDKSGYRREGLLRRSVIKHGVVLDQVVYGCLPEDLDPAC